MSSGLTRQGYLSICCYLFEQHFHSCAPWNFVHQAHRQLHSQVAQKPQFSLTAACDINVLILCVPGGLLLPQDNLEGSAGDVMGDHLPDGGGAGAKAEHHRNREEWVCS
jgi:hypothetical protein